MLIISKVGVASALDHMHTFSIQILGTTLVYTVESRKYASVFCMLALGKTGEGAYARDRDISA